MIVNLHIERLVLDGLPIGVHEGPLVEAAVSAELTRLIGEGGLTDRLARDRTAPLIRAEAIARPAGHGEGIGAQIGRAIYGGIAR